MKQIKRISIPATIVLIGCSSTLNTYEYQAGPQTGLVHVLPLTQFEFNITRRVAECIKADPANNIAAEMKIVTSFAVKDRSIEDADARFVIDPQSLSTWFNSAGVEVTFYEDTRLLKTVNASVKDEAGPALLTAIKVAGAALGVPAGTGLTPVYACNVAAGIPAAVADANAGLAELKTRTAALNKRKTELNKLVAGFKGIVDTSDPALDPNIKAKLTEVRDANAAVQAQIAHVADLLKPISHTTKPIYWPLKGSDRENKTPYALPEATLKKWAGNSPTTTQKQSMYVFVKLEADSNANGIDNLDDKKTINAKGISYRTPQPGRLVFEKIKDPSKPFPYPASVAMSEIHVHRAKVAQLGYIDKLVVSAAPFESLEYTIEFSKKGNLTKAGYKQVGAPIAALTSAVDAIKTEVQALEAAREVEAAAELKALQDEVARREALATLNPPDVTASQQLIDMLTIDTLVDQARIAQLETAARLAELEGG
ncbi:MAG: hypothetical protein ACSHXY_06125 [Alphaproteobacteria bacterium]